MSSTEKAAVEDERNLEYELSTEVVAIMVV